MTNTTKEHPDWELNTTDLQDRAGLPLVLVEIENDCILNPKQGESRYLVLEFSDRKVKDMAPVADISGEDQDRPLYRMYRNVHRPEDEEKIIENGLRFDITMIAPGTINDEKNKTYGHYHPCVNKVLTDLLQSKDKVREIVEKLSDNTKSIDKLANSLFDRIGKIQGSNSTFPELYQVISGRALYLLQEVQDGDVKNIMAVHCVPGDFIIVPPNYGHVTINPGEDVLIMSNWIANFFSSEYDEFTKRGGAAVKLTDKGKWVVNPSYRGNQEVMYPSPKDFTHPLKNSKEPIYKLIENPIQLNFLLGEKT